MYESYADVLESYTIAEEGILSKVKDAGKFMWRKLKDMIDFLIGKVRELTAKLKGNGKRMSRKELMEKIKEQEAQLKESNEERDKYKKERDDFEEKYNKRKKLIKDLDEELDTSYDNYKNIISNVNRTNNLLQNYYSVISKYLMNTNHAAKRYCADLSQISKIVFESDDPNDDSRIARMERNYIKGDIQYSDRKLELSNNRGFFNTKIRDAERELSKFYEACENKLYSSFDITKLFENQCKTINTTLEVLKRALNELPSLDNSNFRHGGRDSIRSAISSLRELIEIYQYLLNSIERVSTFNIIIVN